MVPRSRLVESQAWMLALTWTLFEELPLLVLEQTPTLSRPLVEGSSLLGWENPLMLRLALVESR